MGAAATYPVHVAGEGAQWVHHNEVAAGKGVDEAGAVALSQNVENTWLVEVSQVYQVLHRVLVRRVGL